MSLTRKAAVAAKKPGRPVGQDLAEAFAEREAELAEARRQLAATAEILRVISQAPTDLQPVFERIVVAAARVLRCDMTVVLVREGDVYVHTAAATPEGLVPDFAPEQFPIDASANFPSRAFLTKTMLHLPDWSQIDLTKHERHIHETLGINCALYLPLLRADECIGVLVFAGSRANIFGSNEIAHAESFRDQALIAMENARLFRETNEALEHQKATSEVLQVISRSTFDLDRVFRTLVENAVRLCGARTGMIFQRDGELMRLAAADGPTPAFVDYVRANPIQPNRGSVTGRAAMEGRTIHILDVENDPEYAYGGRALERYRSIVAVPLMRDETPIGVFALWRHHVEAFTPRQIALVETFADQAVVAIENVRLFKETQEALEQQTASAEILQVISSSPTDVQPVFDAIARSAAVLCEATNGTVFRLRDGLIRLVGHYSLSQKQLASLQQSFPVPLDRGTASGRAILDRAVVHIHDIAADPGYSAALVKTGLRSVLSVPMLRSGETIGSINVSRGELRPFSDRQIELLKTFADQAVIAIENVRLFDQVQAKTRDLEELLAQQTATADVLKVISRSAFDLQTVLDTLVASAVQLNGAQSGTICVREGDAFPYRAFSFADEPRLADYLRAHPPVAGRGSVAGRVILSGGVEQVSDILADPEYEVPIAAHGSPARALIAVPLIGKDRLEGVFILSRLAPGSYSARQIEILRTFADQAVIAIENVRLFDEVQARTKELAASLDDLRKAQDRLIQSEKLASLGQLTAGIAHEIKNPLNFVNNYSTLSRELVDELADAIKGEPVDEAKRKEVDELIVAISGNLDKVAQHGKRADAIVKNMLLHSREGSGERSMTNVNAMVEEALNLAYHGARAEKPGFNVTIAKSLDPNAGAAEVYVQEMTRVLLNLIGNGFYATAKRKQSQGDDGYEPTISATTRDRGPSVEIAIRDNGTGISDEVKAKMFNPFFTTKPAGEGTGLGLSLSHDIVVKQHGGTIETSTEPGSFTQFTILLPRGEAGA